MTGLSPDHAGALLLIGASRGIGLAMAGEFVERGWTVVGTVRGVARTGLHDLADRQADRVVVERLDMNEPDEVAALRSRLAGQTFDMMFVNAGTANANQDETVAEVATEEFVRVMVTNALSPMRVVEKLQDLVAADGVIGVMSSGQGSVANNQKGGHEVYRGSKAALNMYMRSYAARHADEARALVALAPGWIRTGLGGDKAPFSLEETVPDIASVLIAQRGRPGLRYLDRFGGHVPW